MGVVRVVEVWWEGGGWEGRGMTGEGEERWAEGDGTGVGGSKRCVSHYGGEGMGGFVWVCG